MQFLITEEFPIVPCGSSINSSVNICFSGMQIIRSEPYEQIFM